MCLFPVQFSKNFLTALSNSARWVYHLPASSVNMFFVFFCFFALLFCFAYKFNVYVTLLIRQKKKIRIKSFFLFLISFHFHILLSRIAEFQRFHIWTQYHRIKPWCLMPDHFHSWIMSFIYPLIQIHKINLWECIKSILTLFKA